MKNIEERILIKCDKCEHEFFLEAVGINEAIVELNGVSVVLVYFACPKCNKIYRVSIQDKRYYELKKELDETKRRIRRLNGKKNVSVKVSETLSSIIARKHERLKAHVEMIQKAFPGEFVFVSSENNIEEKLIKYLP